MSDSHSDLPENIAASGVPREYAIVKDFCPHCNEFMQFDNESRSYGVVQLCRRCRRVMDTMYHEDWHPTPDGIFEVNSGGSN